MKSVSELTDFYYNDLHPHLAQLEAQRMAVRSNLRKAAAVLGAAMLLFDAWLYRVFGGWHQSMLFVLAGALLIGAFGYRFLIRDYTDDFKFRVIRPLIEAIGEELDYAPALYMPQERFMRSKLFNQRIDRYGGNDMVRGRVDGVALQFSDVKAEYRTKDSKGHSSWHTLFQGLFIVAEFNKQFHGTTVVLPDRAEKLFGSVVGGWLQSNNMRRDELVKMDDPEFERAFVVYGTDQIEARYLLTPSMMQRLLAFKQQTGQPLYASFAGSNIYLAVAYNRDLFEPSVFKSLLNYQQAMEYIKTLKLALGIVEELKLNQNLWSKP